MPMKLSEIPGVMIKKDEVYGGTFADNQIQIGKNLLIDQQSEVCIGLSREKLAKKLFEELSALRELGCIWSKQGPLSKEKYYKLADAIIAAESTLIESKGRNGEKA